MKYLLSVLALAFFTSLTQTYAQSAVYYCSATGAYGYCYGSDDVRSCAYNNCLRYGGRSPVIIGSVVYSKGYGAIALGRTANGSQAIGAAAGCRTQAEADRKAISFCEQYGGQDPYVDARFLDE